MRLFRFWTHVVSLLFPCVLFGQVGNASLTGLVDDPSKAVIPKVSVTAINTQTGVKTQTFTNGAGQYVLASLMPGTYRIEIDKQGFKGIIEADLVLHTQDVLQINFHMAVGSMSETVTVNAGAANDNPAVSMTVTREFVENMPLNGRSFQDLIQLAPGTVSNNNGYYSIDGQRTDSNNFTVDGTSANLGGINNIASQNGGVGLSGSAPAQTALGTTQSLASIDELQEFTIQTSGYSAEFGRTPGGQVQFTTRSGTNDIHGSAFDYLRNTIFDANSYSNDYYGIPQTAEHQNDFGGTAGGPLVIPKLYDGKDKTFFFFSYEGLRLLLPNSESEYVPTQAFRQWASPGVQPFMNASPLPNGLANDDGCTISNPTTGQPSACDALFNYGYSYPNNLDSISTRVDHNLGSRFHAFVRYTDTPSSVTSGAEQLQISTINTHSWTAGLTGNLTAALVDDIRFNYSHDGEQSTNTLRSVGGSVPFQESLLIPTAYESATSEALAALIPPNSSLYSEYVYGGTITVQHQYQLTDNLAWTRNKHTMKFGVDWRRLTPTYASTPYNSEMFIESMTGIQQGNAQQLYVSTSPDIAPIFENLSLYGQDRWNPLRRLSIDYGLRWELNPFPGPANGIYPAALTSNNLATAQLAPLGTRPYKTKYDKFAPRFGFSWNAIQSQRHSLTLRASFGIFYDTGQSPVGGLYSGYPYSTVNSLGSYPDGDIPLPLSTAVLTPPAPNLSLVPPYPFLTAGNLSLTLPYTEQWTLSADEALNPKNTLTLSYVGNNGRKLLFWQEYPNAPYGNQDFSNGLNFESNAAQSSYNALQVQDRGRVANGLDLVGSFVWAHALDNASNEAAQSYPIWGNSNYDLRRVLNLALNYQTPAETAKGWIQALAHGWVVANRFSAQTGYPLQIIESTVVLPNGSQAQYSPDLVPGVSIYLNGVSGVPHDWELNRAAFACTTTGATSGPCTGTPTREGTLGRNYVRGPGFWTLNTALQRSFPLHEQVQLVFRTEAFNLFNHPNLGYPNTRLSSSTFGQLNGTVTTIGSSNQLYAMGAARSLQFSLKLQF